MGQVLDSMSDAAHALLTAARAARDGVRLDDHARLVDQLGADHGDEPGVALAVAAERARDVGYWDHTDEEFRATAERLEGLVEEAADEPSIRARLLVGLGGCHGRVHDPGWATRAHDHYLAGARAFLEADEPDAAAVTLANQAWSIDLTVNGLAVTATRLGEAIQLTTSADKAASFLSQRARLHLWRGDLEAAEDDVTQARRLASTAPMTPTTGAYVCWSEVAVHAVRGDARRVRSAIAAAEALRGGWYATITGMAFELEVVDALAHLGLEELSRRHLERMRLRRAEDEALTAEAELVVAALFGPPEDAVAAWQVVRDEETVEPWHRSRFGLLAATALERLGRDPGPTAAEAFDEAARHDLEGMLVLREPDAVDSLLDVAADAGSRAARDLRRARRGHRLELLGAPTLRTPDGEVHALAGRTVALLATLAGHDRGLSAEAVTRQVWDKDDPSGARVRRQLHRLRAAAPIVHRTHDGRLVIGADTAVDLVELDKAVRACRRTREGPLVQAALSRARALAATADPTRLRVTDDLPDNVRTQVVRQLHFVHRRAADHELEHGRDDLAREELRRALALVPDDDVAAAELARLLLAEGRRADAARVLRATAAVLADADLRPSTTFRRTHDGLLTTPDEPARTDASASTDANTDT